MLECLDLSLGLDCYEYLDIWVVVFIFLRINPRLMMRTAWYSWYTNEENCFLSES